MDDHELSTAAASPAEERLLSDHGKPKGPQRSAARLIRVFTA
jgi:hypothetical protein